MLTTPSDEVPANTARDVAAVLAPLGVVARVELLTGGMFATTYRATLTDGRRVVVKTAPTDTDRLLTYELDLVRTEAAVYALAAARPDLLMPAVLLTDFTRTVLPSDVLVVSHLDGIPLIDARDLAPAAHDAVQRDLGAFMARLHTLHGERFGYPNLAAGLHARTWPAAFTAMVGALLDDARRWGTPVPADEVRAALVRHTGALAEVTTASMVHTDLWEANLFVDPVAGRLTGVIDTERAVWGDPLLDLAGIDQLSLGPAPAALLEGYTAAGGTLALGTASGDVRMLLCRVYVSLVTLVEIAPRGYTGAWLDDHRGTATSNLHAALRALGGRAIR